MRHIVCEQLRRKYQDLSATERPRLAAMRSADPPDELPAGRDWNQMVNSGIHAVPSMNHIHIHVVSRDSVVEGGLRLTHFYNTFHTEFLVGLEHFPLARDDVRRPSGSLEVNGGRIVSFLVACLMLDGVCYTVATAAMKCCCRSDAHPYEEQKFCYRKNHEAIH